MRCRPVMYTDTAEKSKYGEPPLQCVPLLALHRLHAMRIEKHLPLLNDCAEYGNDHVQQKTPNADYVHYKEMVASRVLLGKNLHSSREVSPFANNAIAERFRKLQPNH